VNQLQFNSGMVSMGDLGGCRTAVGEFWQPVKDNQRGIQQVAHHE